LGIAALRTLQGEQAQQFSEEAQQKALRHVHELESRLSGLPSELEAGLDPERTAKLLGESLRQHFLNSGIPDTVKSLQSNLRRHDDRPEGLHPESGEFLRPNVTVSTVCISQKPITQFCGTRMCATRIGNGSSWPLRLSGKWVGRCGTDNAEETSFCGGMQSLCCLSGVQRSLPIAQPERLPGGLAHDVGVSCQQHQRGEVGAATGALRRAAKTSPANWTGNLAGKIVHHTRPSTKNSISRRS
jgi:hypothetical protein